MLYKIPDGSYIDLDCIQSVIPEYEGKNISWNDDGSLTVTKESRPRDYLISLANGQQFEIETKDFEAFTKLLIKEGLMMPDPKESEGVLSNDPWAKDGKDSTE